MDSQKGQMNDTTQTISKAIALAFRYHGVDSFFLQGIFSNTSDCFVTPLVKESNHSI